MEQKEFRAWNPIEQEWEYYTLNDLCYNTNRPDICLEKWTQWTGLVDCNGNKIYENDIIKSYLQGSDNFEIWQIEINLYWATQSPQGMAFDNSWIKHEVIGNRFQNPELIKE